MLGWHDLKERTCITDTLVECPVRACATQIRRARKGDALRHPDFQCREHRIYVSPSTFEYADERDNMLWRAPEDLALWRGITAPGVKRECRIARDNSEDGLTWAVFRYLERADAVGRFTDLAADGSLAARPRVIYWSYCPETRKPWKPLVEAARTFGESYARRSEPDVIIDDDRLLVFVENKFTSGNSTKPSEPDNPKLYTTGGDGWFATVFASGCTFTGVAIDARLYELMRLWLLGSWIAGQSGKGFVLVNVVPASARRELDIETRFGRHIAPSQQRRFVQFTWEQLHDEFVKPKQGVEDADLLSAYLSGKTAGYRVNDRRGEAVLQKAFRLGG